MCRRKVGSQRKSSEIKKRKKSKPGGCLCSTDRKGNGSCNVKGCPNDRRDGAKQSVCLRGITQRKESPQRLDKVIRAIGGGWLKRVKKKGKGSEGVMQ